MNERIHLPLRPSGPSLGAYISALDLLAARLDTLASRARWPARVPINSKASFDGHLVHTDQVRVDIGAGWWVEMSATEAAAYVRRRKAYFLDEHARLLEGKPRALETTTNDTDITMAPAHAAHRTAPQVRFDPLFANPLRVPSPAEEGAEGAAPAPALSAAAESAAPVTTLTPATPQTPVTEPEMELKTGSSAMRSLAATAPASTAPMATAAAAPATDGAMPTASAQPAKPAVTIPGLPNELQYLVDLLGTDLGDKLSLPAANGNETLNDEGLPIHEIRETLDGDTIGDAPAPSGNGAVDAAPEEDYFAPEAVARREALKRRLFHDDSEDDDEDDDDDGDDDDDDDEDEGMDVDSPSPEAAPAPQAAPPAPATPEPTLAPPLDTPAASPPAITRSPSNPPKSILKAPTRKKSVTFDPSTRLPPDSPPAHSPTGGSLRIGRLGFPVADTVSESSAGPKPVPILAPPTPGRKSTGTATFGGFKRGFLTGPGSTPPAVPAPSSAVVEGPKVVEVGGVDIEEKPKKQSLFAQRRAAPALPRLADAKPMAAMKTAIVETPSQPVHRALADRLPTPVAPRFPTDPANPVLVVDHDDDESDYGDLGDFSDDEEDEYALDEALLQREVALALHARQGWVRPVDEDEIDQEAEDGVLMGVPRVSTITGSETDPLRIVNPTADDLGQFLRVGRADDGELVFERPIVHDSESEGDDDGEGSQDRRERRARRRDVMARLLAGDYEDGPAGVHPAQRAAEWQASLPPSVGAAPAPVPAAAPPAPRRIETGPVVERSGPAPAAVPVPVPAPAPAEPAAPRKVSRFKASGQ